MPYFPAIADYMVLLTFSGDAAAVTGSVRSDRIPQITSTEFCMFEHTTGRSVRLDQMKTVVVVQRTRRELPSAKHFLQDQDEGLLRDGMVVWVGVCIREEWP